MTQIFLVWYLNDLSLPPFCKKTGTGNRVTEQASGTGDICSEKGSGQEQRQLVHAIDEVQG